MNGGIKMLVIQTAVLKSIHKLLVNRHGYMSTTLIIQFGIFVTSVHLMNVKKEVVTLISKEVTAAIAYIRHQMCLKS